MAYVALITGASSGIGEATARRLAREPDTQLILVARREDRLLALAEELGRERIVVFPADLTDPEAPAQIALAVDENYGSLNLLVNNAGARWSMDFADGGRENVEQHMRVNFEAPVRLIEALLPLLRRTAAASGPLATGSVFAGRPLRAPVAIVNVTSTAARISRLGTGGYSASKNALAAWSDSLYLEQRAHNVHVGNVLPGFVSTEGFPQAELRARALTRRFVAEPAVVAEAVLDAGPGGAPECYVPRYYRLGALLRVVAPRIVRRWASSDVVTTNTNSV
ncbi:MAG TPA: SDR family NAD(P)-dependent oxidoreductase [Solirubrobacteraceae bacterium]|jgi:short-subunit dehydrogenase|nr:SDR family NAD(P)-dependent oxidoreductase [Solirubrobacteraceae bacterium]